jgi:N-acetylglucosaminyl-diphospho-decaprenol L-rhamnosyltransferase
VQLLSVAIVNHNTRDLLRTCIQSALDAGAEEIVLVDNASDDGAPEMVRAEFPMIHLIINLNNGGMGAAANQAVERCTRPYVLLLNSDTVLRHGALPALSAYLSAHPRAGLVGPRLRNPDGTLQPSCFHYPTPLHVALELGSMEVVIRRIPLLRQLYLRTWDHQHAQRVPWVLGAAIALRRSAFNQIGGFDQAYFMYSEEVDLCYRLRKAGWEIHFTPSAEIIHVGGASTRRARLEMTRQLFRSKEIFYQRHYSRLRLLLLRLIVYLFVSFKLVRDLTRLLWSRLGPRKASVEEVTTWAYVLKDTARL